MFEVCLAGTGGMLPLPRRWLTGLWLEKDGNALLIDCGEGMQIELAESGCKISRLDTLLITHFHADHTAGLPGLLLSAGNAGKTTPLKLYGVSGITEYVEKLCCICPELPFELEINELSADEITSFDWNGTQISAMPVRHRIPCLCYSVTEQRKPVFNPQKATALNVPQSLWKTLHGGSSVSCNGMTVMPEMVTDGSRKPLKLTYMTDTVYFDKLAEYARDSDLLICEGMYGSDEFIPKMTEKCHLVFSQAAKIAEKSCSEELWLTHYSPALIDPDDYAEEMHSMFKNTVLSRDGQRGTIK